MEAVATVTFEEDNNYITMEVNEPLSEEFPNKHEDGELSGKQTEQEESDNESSETENTSTSGTDESRSTESDSTTATASSDPDSDEREQGGKAQKRRKRGHGQSTGAAKDSYVKTIYLMQSFMIKKGLINESMGQEELKAFLKESDESLSANSNSNNTSRRPHGGKNSRKEGEIVSERRENDGAGKTCTNDSETTVYKNAVEVIDARNISSSSGEFNDTSDKNFDLMNCFKSSLNFNSGTRGATPGEGGRHDYPSTSDERCDRQRGEQPTPDEQADKILGDAEHGKARMMDVPGNNCFNVSRGSLLHSVVVDEGYLTVAAHIDEQLRKKILSFEYVDFSRLLPRD